MDPAVKLLEELRYRYEQAKAFQRDLALGGMVVALAEAARDRVTLSAEHHAILADLESLLRRMYPESMFSG